MSALAQALVGAGMRVTGSDRYLDAGDPLPVIAQLRAAGVTFVAQDGRAVTHDTCAVVLSTAIEGDNPDVQAAVRLGVPRLHRSMVLAGLTTGKRCIAVTGTSGKSTVTGMIGWILDVAGFDPVVINGAPVLNWADAERVGNYRDGKSAWCVIEADESDRSLLNYAPQWGVITNASRDHFEMDETLRLFAAFRAKVTQGVVSTLDEPTLLTGARIAPGRDGVIIETAGLHCTVPLMGAHNGENAVIAATLCRRMGIDAATVVKGLETFRGVARRLERIGTARGVLVVDDYGHNPAKIRAAWESLAPHAARVFGIWRPHGFGPLRSMLDDLTETFATVCRPDDRLFVLPVYDVGGTADRSVHAGVLVERLRARGVQAAVAEVTNLPEQLAGAVGPGDVVVTMGARDPHLTDLARDILRNCKRG